MPGSRPWRTGGTVTLAACWVRARRRFYDLLEAGSPVATDAVRRIGELYEIEAPIRRQPPDKRCRVRQQLSTPRTEALQAWFDVQLSRLPGEAHRSSPFVW